MTTKGTELALIKELSTLVINKGTIATTDFTSKYDLLTRYIDELTKIKEAVDVNIKAAVLDNYLKTGESTVDSGEYKFTYVPESTRERLDTKALKTEHPDLYKEYVKISNVSASLRITKAKKTDEESK